MSEDPTGAERQKRFRENRKKRLAESLEVQNAAANLSKIIRHAADNGVPLAREVASNTTLETLTKLQEYFLAAAPIATPRSKSSTKNK